MRISIQDLVQQTTRRARQKLILICFIVVFPLTAALSFAKAISNLESSLNANVAYVSYLLNIGNKLELIRSIRSVQKSVPSINYLALNCINMDPVWVGRKEVFALSQSVKVPADAYSGCILMSEANFPFSEIALFALVVSFLPVLVLEIARRELKRSASQLIEPLVALNESINSFNEFESDSLVVPSSRSQITEVQSIFQSFADLRIRLARAINKATIESGKQAVMQTALQVAHDIRSPIGAIHMAAKSEEAPFEDRLSLILAATRRIQSISDGLLAEAKQSKQIPPRPLNEVVNELMREVVFQYSAGNHEFDYHAERSSIVLNEVESSGVQSAISNLINNAVESMPHGGKVTVKLAVGDGFDRLVIRDNGNGIPSEILCRLGEVGFTHGKTQSNAGTGLGVSSASAFFNSLGGNLTFESEVGVGTQATAFIPVRRDRQRSETETAGYHLRNS